MRRAWRLGGALLLLAMVARAPLRAEDEVTPGLQAGLALVGIHDDAAGAGTRSRKTGQPIHDPAWTDGFVKPSVTATLDEGAYGGVSLITAWTLGSGDGYAPPGALQSTVGGSSHTDVETAYAGWRSGPDAGKTADGVDLSAGRQEFVVGDGFLLGDGHWDRGKDAGYYSGGRLAWRNSAIVSLALLPVRADLFWVKGDVNTGGTAIEGINTEWLAGDHGTVGAAWMRVLNDNVLESEYPARAGMQLWDFRAQGNPWPELFLSGEISGEHNGGSHGVRQRATAWYAEIAYTLASDEREPTIGLRRAHFGDGWDPLHYGAVRGWGTWFMGEIVGEYLLFNSNEDVTMLYARLRPAETLVVGAAGYRFTYAKPAMDSRDFGMEADLYAIWTPMPWLSLTPTLGVFVPGRGAAETYGARRNGQVAETLVTVKF